MTLVPHAALRAGRSTPRPGSRSWPRPIIAITLLLVIAGAVLRHRHLRPGQGRRPDPLPAPLLDLLAPGGLHHDPAGHGRHHRDHPDLRPADHLRLQGHRLLEPRASPASASLVWAHHMFTSGMSDVRAACSSRCSRSWWPSRAPSRSSTGWRRSTRAPSTSSRRCSSPSPSSSCSASAG